jgi:hypothetical protein
MRTMPLYSTSSAATRVTTYALVPYFPLYHIIHISILLVANYFTYATGYCSWTISGSTRTYWALHSSKETWLVSRREYCKTKSWVSRLAYVRRVSFDPTTNAWTCTCHFHERHGIPCRHLYLFLGEVRSTDFDVRWWITYAMYYGESGYPTPLYALLRH